MGPRRRAAVLATCCCSLLMATMDSTIVNVALPSIRRDLHASLSGLQWIVDTYTLVLAGLLMLSGSTADRLGRRRMFQIGLLTFTAGSLLCSVAPGLGWLVAARAVQAIGGSMLNPVAMSIITNVFTGRGERARAIGVWGGVSGLSMALGPIVGGLLTETVGWRAIFWINLPIGIAAVVAAALFVPESRAARPRRPDPLGQLLIAAALAMLAYAIIEGPRIGWRTFPIAGPLAASVVVLTLFVVYERHREEPLLDVRLFRSIPFSGAIATAVVAYSGSGAFLFLNTLYLQDSRGFSALGAGLATLPLAVASFTMAPTSGRIVAARGTRLPLYLAGACAIGAAAVMVRVTAATPLALLLVTYFVYGTAMGMVNSPITNTAVSGMPRAQAGVAAAVASTSRQVGQSLGVALAGSLAASAVRLSGTDFARATHPTWWMVMGCGVGIVSLCAASTTRRAAASARRVATLMAEEPVGSRATPVPGDVALLGHNGLTN
jgi:EmrB/QacA subfamily drug resistance transporter